MAVIIKQKIMTNQTNMKNMNDFVLNFLENAGAEDFIDVWEQDDNQKELKVLLEKLRPRVQRTSKKAKDPNKPKRANSAYLFFCKDQRSVIKEEHPEMNAKEITSELGARWQVVKDDEDAIAEYVAQALEDKKRYNDEKDDYVPPEPCDDEQPSKGRKKKAKKDGPKRPKSAYLFFCQEQRPVIKENNPEMSTTDITSQLGVEWQNIKDTDAVAEYKELAEADKLRFEEEKKNWVECEDSEEVVATKSKSKSKPKPKAKPTATKAKVKAVAKPVARSKVKPETSAPKNVTPYNRFQKLNREEVRNENPDLKAPEITKLLSAMWKELSEQEKAEYAEAE